MPDLLHPAEGPDDDEGGDQDGLADGDFVVAATADDRIEAGLLVRACEDAGIPAIVRAPRESMVGKIDAPADSHEILVRTTDLARARVLLADRRASLAGDQALNEQAAVDEEAAEEAADAAEAAQVAAAKVPAL